MGRSSLFAVLALLPLFACDADENPDAEFRSWKRDHDQHGKQKHEHKHKQGKKHKKHHQQQPYYIYPGSSWQMGVPEFHGLSSQGLAEMATVAGQTDTSCLVVIADGLLVGEWYWGGYDAYTPLDNVWSLTKSVTSAVVGVADAEGLLDIHDPAADYIPQWQGTDREVVSIFDLLNHTSGGEWDFYSDLELLSDTDITDFTSYSLSFGQELEPGARWDYSNIGVQTLEAALDNAISGDLGSYYEDRIFEPIGMNATSVARDPSGNVLTYSGISTTCRDLARFGYLYLRKGRWWWNQVVPQSWVEMSTQPSSPLNDAYGLLWWLNAPGHVVLPSTPERLEYEGQMLPSAPEGGYMAFGAFGQLLFVDPTDDYVVVRLTDVYDDPLGLDDMDAILGAFEDAKFGYGDYCG